MATTHEKVQLGRDCDAVAVPYGMPVRLPAGTSVTITQTLGGTYTVMTELGQLARIDAKDADALGLQAAATPQAAVESGEPLDAPKIEKIVWDLLRTCYDPEIPVNIVDLGLVYFVGVTPMPDAGHRVDVRMTLTAPGCGMGAVLKADIESRVRGVPTVREALVELVMDPPWNPGMMSETAKLELGFM